MKKKALKKIMAKKTYQKIKKSLSEALSHAKKKKKLKETKKVKVVKKRGRPKGSKNKVKISAGKSPTSKKQREGRQARTPKKRGRPKGSKNSVKNKTVKKQRKTLSPKNKAGGKQKIAKNKKTPAKNKVRRKRRKRKAPEFIVVMTEGRHVGHTTFRKEIVENKPENVHTSHEEIDTSHVVTGRVLGYCNGRGCQSIITNLNLEEGKKNIFMCTECGKRARVSQLRKEPLVPKEKNYDPWKGKK